MRRYRVVVGDVTSFKPRRRKGRGGRKKAPVWAVPAAMGVGLVAAAATYSPHGRIDPPVYYPNCDAARAAGVAPIHAGEPGYREPLDADGDGVACEPLPQL